MKKHGKKIPYFRIIFISVFIRRKCGQLFLFLTSTYPYFPFNSTFPSYPPPIKYTPFFFGQCLLEKNLDFPPPPTPLPSCLSSYFPFSNISLPSETIVTNFPNLLYLFKIHHNHTNEIHPLRPNHFKIKYFNGLCRVDG